MIPYELIDHTADIGVRVCGKNLQEVFRNAALAMFDMMVELRKSKRAVKSKEMKIKCQAQNIEELLVRWLSELVSLSDYHHVFFTDFRIDSLEPKALCASAESVSNENFVGKCEIKAVTYHGLKIIQNEQGYIAEVIFDV